MNQEKVKLIIKNMELLIQSLKEEINQKEKNSYDYEEITSYIDEYEPDYYEED